MLTLDGREGEGGGQILRLALALGAITSTPFTIRHIRGGRARPGLLRQHLTGVRAVAEACGARVDGAELRSETLTFAPGPIAAGDYRFAVGTAGSTGLVLQALLPVLWHASGPSTVTVTGGTHNQAAPPTDFLARTLLPVLSEMGFAAELELEAHGFYPAGGGRVRVSVTPAAPRPLEIVRRGDIGRIEATALSSNLPDRIATRELAVLREGLPIEEGDRAEARSVASPGPGNVVVVAIVADAITEVVTAFGRRGTPAEAVAQEAVDAVHRYRELGAPVGEHLADQLLLPLAIAGGRFVTGPLSAHSQTAISVIERFLGRSIAIGPQEDQRLLVECSI